MPSEDLQDDIVPLFPELPQTSWVAKLVDQSECSPSELEILASHSSVSLAKIHNIHDLKRACLGIVTGYLGEQLDDHGPAALPGLACVA